MRGALLLGLGAGMLLGAAPARVDVSARITDLRSTRGNVLACLTTRADAFPDCSKDPAARKLTVPATDAATIDFGPVPQGRYAISLVHDENGNGRMDKRLMLPREGFGFSLDAPVRFGPPSFANAAFTVGNEPERLSIRMRYML